MRIFQRVWIGIALAAIGFGMVLLIITFASGVTIQDMSGKSMHLNHNFGSEYSYQESYTDVKSMDIRIQYGDVKIIQGDSFSIDAKRLPENGLNVYVKDGVWTIEENETHLSINIFGQKIPLGRMYHWNILSPEITITVPKNFTAEKFSMIVDAGSVSVDELHANEGAIEVLAGILSFEKMEINNKSYINVGAGQFIAKQARLNNVAIDCNVGSVVIEGGITGDNDITCNVGSVKLKLNGNRQDYAYDVKVDIGNVVIDQQNYKNDFHSGNSNSDTANNLSLNCNIGSIEVDFY